MRSRREFSVSEIAEIRDLLHAKARSDRDTQKRYRERLRNLGLFISDFERRTDGFSAADLDDLIASGVITVAGATEPPRAGAQMLTGEPAPEPPARRHGRDEAYVIDLCDEILGSPALRQHRFRYLVGDSGVPLPVDAYYPHLQLVVEYLERQHRESVAFFDRKPTVSNVSRGEQRRLYDQRRREILPSKGITLLEISPAQLSCNSRERLLRDRRADTASLRKLLRPWLSRSSGHAV